DRDRYLWDYPAYEQFVALCEQEAEGSRSDPKRRRTYIPREREDAEQRLTDDYFGDNKFLPKYPEENFRRRYRWSNRSVDLSVSVAMYGYVFICVCVGYVILDNQSIERDRLIGIGFVLNFLKFMSFTFGDKEMISVIEAVSR
ncbi:hypothetical protein Tco_1576717, partial [Tanacetum coccineum]